MSDDIQIYTLKEIDSTLIQLYEWQDEQGINWLKQQMDRILSDGTRKAFLEKRGIRYSVFVDDVSNKQGA